MTNEQLTERLRAVLAFLWDLTDEERLSAFMAMGEVWCLYCGRAHPDGRECQCWNDE